MLGADPGGPGPGARGAGRATRLPRGGLGAGRRLGRALLRAGGRVPRHGPAGAGAGARGRAGRRLPRARHARGWRRRPGCPGRWPAPSACTRVEPRELDARGRGAHRLRPRRGRDRHDRARLVPGLRPARAHARARPPRVRGARPPGGAGRARRGGGAGRGGARGAPDHARVGALGHLGHRAEARGGRARPTAPRRGGRGRARTAGPAPFDKARKCFDSAASRTYRRLMRGVRRQIVALGGGGFSMEAGNPLLDDYVLGLTGSERPRVCFLPSASGDADHYIVRFYQAFAGPLRGVARVALQARGQRRPARAPALPGPHLRRGGQRGEPARRVARARPRRRDARGVGGGRGALRRLGRLALLVRRGHHGLPRPARALPRPRPPRMQQHRPLRRRARARGRLPRRAPQGDAPRVRGGRRRRAAFRGRAAAARRVVAPRRAGVQDAKRARARDQEPAARVLPRGRGAGGRAAAPPRLAALPRPPALAGAALGGRRAAG